MIKVSVIVPCYNQGQFLTEALESVMNQTYNDWECIVINDGSADNTNEIANEWLSRDDRFKYIEIDNGGLSNARNTGIRIARGEFILPLDADDKISKDYIELAISEFNNDPTLKLVYCKAEKFGNEHGPWKLRAYSLKKLAFINMIFCSALFRKTEWERVGGYDVNMVYGIEDWEFWISILKNGGNVKQIDKIGFYYRIRNDSKNNSISKEQYKVLFDYMSTKHVDFFVKYVGNFHVLSSINNDLKARLEITMKSKKHAVNVLFKSFIGKDIFKLD
jgi:glycosyltransferase involved in cell wall biosynthesis